VTDSKDPIPLSTKDHWDQSYERVPLPRIIDPGATEAMGRYHEEFLACLGRGDRPFRMLEIGCAASAWLPYFHRTHGCEVFGIDYAEEGVELARKNLSLLGVPGDIRVGDVLSQGGIFEGTFDGVASFGLVEHFRHPDRMIRVMAEYLAPGGLMFTQVPNLRGIFGWGLRLFRRPLYEIHHPMSLQDLMLFHERAGLERFRIPGYLGCASLNMIASSVVPGSWPRLVRAGISTAARTGGKLLAGATRRLPEGSVRRFLAPDIFVVYRKPAA
jgi:SAM-dependent methyltransferase